MNWPQIKSEILEGDDADWTCYWVVDHQGIRYAGAPTEKQAILNYLAHHGQRPNPERFVVKDLTSQT